MDVPFHFGILPHLNASFVLFEEMNRGKARTELVIQDMKDGDIIGCYGRTAERDIHHRLMARGLKGCQIRCFTEEDFTNNPHWMAKVENRLSRQLPNGCTIHVDHTLIYKIVEIGLKNISHEVGYLVGMIGQENERSVILGQESRRLHQNYPIERGDRK